MDQVTIEISSAPGHPIRLLGFPELSSDHKLVNRGIAILKEYTPGVLSYLSKQRLLSRLPSCRIDVRAGSLADDAARKVLAGWMRRKRNRRLAYVILELLLMPFTAFVALLPGPNVVFYGLFVLFYFHFKAFLSLSKIKVEELDITIIRDA